MYNVSNLKRILSKLPLPSITLGSDVEYFLYSKEAEQYLPASAVTDGTKDVPEHIGEGIEIHADNVALEHSVPVSTLEDFEFNMKFAKRKVEQFLANSDFPDMQLMTVPSLDTSFEWALQMAPEYTEFGCSPFKTPDGKLHDLCTLKDEAWRFIGMHIHVGYPSFSSENNAEVIRIVDAMCDHAGFIDRATIRTESYGMQGAYRDTKYGVEYRRLTPDQLPNIQHIAEICSLSVALVTAGITVDDVFVGQLTDVKYVNSLFENVQTQSKVEAV